MSDKKLKIGLIISTTREGRFADKVLEWFTPRIAAREDMEYELLDLRDFVLPHFEETKPPAALAPGHAVARAWEAKLAECDGFIVLTAEYNHSIPGALKNAFDYAFKGWHRKLIGTVGWGGVGAARAVEHLRMIAINFGMVPVRGAVTIGGGDFVAAMQGKGLPPEGGHLDAPVKELLDDMAYWGRAANWARENA